MRSRLIALTFITTLTFSCAPEIGKGKFAFFAADQQQLNNLEEKLYQPRRFKKFKPPISFAQDKTLWYIYKPDTKDYKLPYAISLQKKSLGYIEIDLKNKMLSPEVGGFIDLFEDLEVGHYAIKIAYKNLVIDEIKFSIERKENPDSIDFDAPISDDPESDDIDDIEFYSK